MSISPIRTVAQPRRAMPVRPATQAPAPARAAAPVRAQAARPVTAKSESRLAQIARSLFAGGGIGMGVGALACAGLTAFGVAGGMLAFNGLCVAGLAAGALYGIFRSK
jgi:hypothetical protein